MHIGWTYDGCDEHDVPVIERYWDQVRIELDGKLAELSDAPVQLGFAVEQSEDKPTWRIQAALHIPGQTIVASAASNRPESALDEVLHRLAERIDSLQDVSVRVTQRREGLDGVVRLLEAWRSEPRSEAFMSFLAPLVASVGPYVGRELQVREREGALIGEDVTTPDVLDEMLVQAWELFHQRDPQLPFDLWLVRLAEQVMDRLGSHAGDSSIDDEAPVPASDWLPFDDEAWIEQVSYPESIDLSELLTDGPGVAMWDDLDLESKQAHLAELLGHLGRDQRQAFVLHVAHGYNFAEIGDFQQRRPEQVDEDVAQAIATIRRLCLDEQAPDQEEPFARAELRQRRKRYSR